MGAFVSAYVRRTYLSRSSHLRYIDREDKVRTGMYVVLKYTQLIDQVLQNQPVVLLIDRSINQTIDQLTFPDNQTVLLLLGASSN